MFYCVSGLLVGFVMVGVLLLNIMVLLCVRVGLLLPFPCMVLHNVCVFYLGSDPLFKYSLMMSVLCCFMREVISEFILKVWIVFCSGNNSSV